MGMRTVWSPNRKQRVLTVALAVALLCSLVLVHASGLAVADQEALKNGGFENGFTVIQGCGAVGTGWGCFTNGGSITYGFFDDQWASVVSEGKHSQLIELNTLQVAASEPDRYAGIYQTVNVAKGGSYQLQLKGLVRERNPNAAEDRWRYRVQWGYTADASTDWTRVTNWAELPWDKIDERTSPTFLQSYASPLFTAPSSRITLFLRVWKKWGTPNKDIDVNLDAISLFGPPAGAGVTPPALPQTGGIQPVTLPESGGPVPAPSSSGIIVIPPAGGNPAPQPPAAQPSGVVLIPPAQQAQPGGVVLVPPVQQAQPSNIIVIPSAATSAAPTGSAAAGVCTGPNYLRNGDFEGGFGPGPSGSAVGSAWTGFNNGGLAYYGYYDEKWTAVIKDGQHGQLLEINTNNLGSADANRVSGIFQVVGGLTPGATYEFSMWGLLREELAHPDEDAFRYRVQWGYASGSSAASIANWADVPWDTIYVRESAGPMLPFSAQFQAPGSSLVIGVRAVKKWGTIHRELDVDLDAIRLLGCGSTPVVNPCPIPTCYACTGCAAPAHVAPAYNPPAYTYTPPSKPVSTAPRCTWYTVKRGDTLASIAARYRTTVASLMRTNHIANANLVYAGQQLCVDP